MFDFQKLQLLVQVCSLFHFLLHSIFFKVKVKDVFLVGFIGFFQVGFFKKITGVFLHQPWCQVLFRCKDCHD